MLLRPKPFISIHHRENCKRTGRTTSSTMSYLLCIGKGSFVGRVVPSPRTVIDVFSIRRTRAPSVPRGWIFRTMTARAGRAGTHGRFRHSGRRPNDAEVYESPTTIGRRRQGRRGRKRNRIIQADAVDDPACPGPSLGRHPGPPRDSNGVAAVRTRQEPGTMPTYRALPSFVTSLLNLSKAPN